MNTEVKQNIKRPIVLSGVKPTGIPTLGNYLGALKNFAKLQNEMTDYDFYIFVADLHAITVPQNPKELKQNIRNVAALYLACGLEPERLVLFLQSEVHEHAELGYVMQSISYMGELERMTQFKDKVAKNMTQGVTSALFTYPTLMAADILLYDAKYVPVGDDQKQHLELTRDLGTRFNNRFGNTFNIPECLVTKQGSRIMDLQDPTKKMSKSDETYKGVILLLDDEKIIRKKIDKKINNLLLQLKLIDENGDDEEGIKRSLMEAEKLRIQIINNYIKYLGNTYQSLTMKKIQIIVNQLRFKLYKIQQVKRYNNMIHDMNDYQEEYGSRRGR